MIIDHVAIWTNQLEVLKHYYVTFFEGHANEKYTNSKTRFESYFISFDSGCRLELMQMPDISERQQDDAEKKYQGIIHLSFGVEDMQKVIDKSHELEDAGFRILRGPRKTGDGYFEFETLDPDGNRLEVTSKA